jgi:uncharacterized protein (TIGR03437 family)
MKRLASCVVSCLVVCAQGGGQSGIITTIAGIDNGGFSGDGGPATSAQLSGPSGIVVDGSGNLYVADTGNGRIRKVSVSGVITTVAGNGSDGFSGDGGPATAASLNIDVVGIGIAVDTSGNLFIADINNNRVRKVSAGGIITTVAGNGFGAIDGIGGFSGDGGPATAAELFGPSGIAVDASGNLFIVDLGNMRIRKVSASGIITTVAGSGCVLSVSTPNCGGFSGDGGPATSATLNHPSAIAVDSSGNLFIADTENNRIRKVAANGIITTVAGNGPVCQFSSLTCSGGFSGDGGPATSASLNFPGAVTLDRSGNLFIADTGNLRVREVSSNGIIATFAGNGQFDHNISPGPGAGDGGPATSALLNDPEGVAADASGNLFIADALRGRIREVFTSTPSPALTITSGGIVPVDSSVNTIQPGEWVSIFGMNLASSTVTWIGNFPTNLGGTSVTVNGKAAYLSFVSPSQINLQAPNDTVTGSVPVVVTTASGTAASTVTLAQFAPSFLLLDSKHVAGVILRSNGSGAYGGGSYDILGPTGNSLGYATVAAKAGDTIALYAVGLGPTAPAVPAGQPFSGSAPATYSVNLLINKVNVIPTFAGLSSAGLYQINLAVPSGLTTGDVSLVAAVGGAQTPTGVVISLQ